MDFLQDMLKEKSGDLIAQLTGKAGFTRDVAERFIPEAGTATIEALTSQSSSLDLADIAAPGNVSSLLRSMDVGALASRVGISSDQVTGGLSAILPTILGLIGSKAEGAGGLGALLGLGGGLKGAADKLKGLGGGLLG